MKRLILLIAGGLLALVIGGAGWLLLQQRRAVRVYAETNQALAQSMMLVQRGGDPAPAFALLKQVGPAMDAGHPAQAFSLAQRALDAANAALQALPPPSQLQLPIDSAPELSSDLYGHPQPVVITGYTGDAMEPFISPDGKYLFFNNSNDAKTDTNLYYARRTGKLTFRSLGELPGVNSPSLDAVPSIDASGRFYFTSLRDYDRTHASLFTGEFDGRAVHDVHRVPGDIDPGMPGIVNMDASISPDGQTLYIARAHIIEGAPVPKSSGLVMATLSKGNFKTEETGTILLIHINTGALNYAPCISADGLELYFTRASQRMNAAGKLEPSVRIMVATRPSTDVSFGTPMVLSALTGFVEAPTLSLDRKEMFFHKKVGDHYAIFRATRTN